MKMKEYTIEVSAKGEEDNVFLKHNRVAVPNKAALSQEVGKLVVETYDKGYHSMRVIIKKQ